MRSWSNVLCALTGSCVLLGCASNGSDSAGTSPDAKMTMAAATCANLQTQRQQCEKGCPTVTGEEHFSVQHKIAMENSACKERCAEASNQQATSCKTVR